MYKIPETEEEICRAYRLARNKRKQIGILADLTQRKPAEIAEILEQAGEKPRNKKRRRNAPPSEAKKKKDYMVWTAKQETCADYEPETRTAEDKLREAAEYNKMMVRRTRRM